jgi:hypothetical protein
LAVLSVFILLSALRLPRWNASIEERLRTGLSPLRVAFSALRSGLEIAIPLVILLIAPSLMQPGISWRTLVVSTPDVGWWALYFSGLLLVTGVMRGFLLGRALLRRRRVAAAVPVLQPSVS